MYDLQTKSKSNLNNDKKKGTSKTRQEAISAMDFQKPVRSNIFRSVVQQNTDIGSSVIREKPNLTGLPDSLKNGIESLSGYSMDDVRVHYNSSGPAQLQSLAYARGKDIYVAPGQEKHLGHEAWHIVQQKQGRVAPTMQMNSVNINNDAVLEREADIMGAKAIQMKAAADTANLKYVRPVSCVQRMGGDLRCKATVHYKGGDFVEEEADNGVIDFNCINGTFANHGLIELSNLDKITNATGACAEPQALANALKKSENTKKQMTK